MDDRRFDSLVKALAEGKSRRSVLKGLLGLGGVAIASSVERQHAVDAARRPTPTPTPVRCPGQQTPVGGQCVCQVPKAPGPEKCGPDCCNPAGIGAAHSECCDNACCFGHCYGEELCCKTNTRIGGAPPLQRICDTVDGTECCPYDDDCCIIDGCCSTVCFGGSVDADRCCPQGDFCPGGTESEDKCCPDGATCCGGGTNANVCVDLGTEGACCSDSDCGDPCQLCHPRDHVCIQRCNPESERCCVDEQGVAVCQQGTCCPNGPGCEEGQVCCVTGGVARCEAGPNCGCDSNTDCDACYVCNRGTCIPIEGFDPATEFCCGGEPCTNGNECCNDFCCPTGRPCCDNLCYDPDVYVCCDDELVEAECCVDAHCPGDDICCDGACCTGTCCVDYCCESGWPCCGSLCYDPEVMVCCEGQPVEAECCVDAHCPGDDICCDGACCTGTCCVDYCCESGWPCCGSLCYDPEQLNCCNGQPVEATCCTANPDCPGACEYCDTNQGYCVGCPADRPQCCTNSLGSTCIAAGAACCDPVNCGWSAWGPCLDGIQTRTPDNPPVACGGIPCDPSQSTQACCLESNTGPCTFDGACCSGICQFGVCYESIATTCQSGQDYCGSAGAQTCSGDISCNCAVTSDGTTMCVDHVDCQSTCDFCEAGTYYCDLGETTCCGAGMASCFVLCPPTGGGCFTAVTRIALPDGSSRRVADLAVGDIVLGADGQINRIEAIERPQLGNRPLYAIDDSGFFVTASHPFLTDDGWKSIDPAATAREHGAMPVGRLRIGDRVRMLNGVLALAGGREPSRGHLEIDVASMLVERIEPTAADPAIRLYNLRLDGNQTYFANGLLVHNK